MNAETLTYTLGGKWTGHGGIASCPVPGHGKGRGDRNPSLSISSGARQPIIVHCFGGCSQADVIAALRQRGLWPGGGSLHPTSLGSRSANRARARNELALRLWSAGVPVKRTAAECYLAGRGVVADSKELRFLPASSGHDIPATVDGALMTALRDRDNQLHAVQLTYVTDEGHKANAVRVRRTVGTLRGSAVQLQPAGPVLGLAEGLETALSATVLHRLPVWAVCGARLDDAPVPACVQQVCLFADNDPPGLAAAGRAEAHFKAKGLIVEVCAPAAPGADWNDVLLASVRVRP